MIERGEEPFGDGVVMPFAMKLRGDAPGFRIARARIAAANVNAEHCSVKAADEIVVGSDRHV